MENDLVPPESIATEFQFRNVSRDCADMNFKRPQAQSKRHDFAQKRRKLNKAEGSYPLSWYGQGRVYGNPGAHAFPSTHISGNARVVLGNVYGDFANDGRHNGGDDHEIYKVLEESLRFDHMDTRRLNIATAMPKTCEWLFGHRQFLIWENDRASVPNHGFLWIKGKPGCGKSTLMRTAFARAKDMHRATDTAIISYFFNARAADSLERSSLGLYRSLVHELLQNFPKLKSMFLTRFSSKSRNGLVTEWSIIELQGFLIDLVRTPHISPIIVYVDALDEGDETDVRRMVAFFEDLSSHAVSSATRLRICLSSRHYPHITINGGHSITVELQSEHDRDIERYVCNKLKGVKSLQTNELRKEICRKSAGIFLWVVLVIPILNAVYDKGRGVQGMKTRLKSVPAELDALFIELLSKSSDDFEECISLLQWVLHSVRLLRPAELYYAVNTRFTPLLGTKGPVFPDRLTIEKYLLDCSRGLVECLAERPGFIHETVRTFLLSDRFNIDRSHKLATSSFADSHEKLRNVCLEYINNSNFDHRNPPESSRQLPMPRPFLNYAVENMFRHAEEAQRHGADQSDFLKMLVAGSMAGFTAWLGFWNMFHLPDRQHSVGKYLQLTADNDNVGLRSLLYVCAEQDLQALVKCLLDLGIDINTQVGRCGGALDSAQCMWENYSPKRTAVQVFGFCVQIEHKHVRIDQLLHARNGWLGREVNSIFFEKNALEYTPSIEALIELGVKVGTEHANVDTSLELASQLGHERTVKVLLDHGATRTPPSCFRLSALYRAAINGHDTIVQMLLDYGTKFAPLGMVTAGDVPLETLLDEKNWSCREWWFQFGARREKSDSDFRPPLRLVSSWFFEDATNELVCLLLDKPVFQTDTVDIECALLLAVRGSDQRIIELLLDQGAHINAYSAQGKRPWQNAMVSRGHGFVGGGSMKLAQVPFKRNATVDTTLHRASQWLLMSASDCPFKRGAHFRAKNLQSNTIVHLVIRHGRSQRWTRVVLPGSA